MGAPVPAPFRRCSRAHARPEIESPHAARRSVKIPQFRVRFPGRVLVLGCGSVSQCLQPLLLRHLDMDFRKLTVMDFEDLRSKIPDTLAAGARYDATRITPENIGELLSKHLGPGDLLIDLAWNIDAGTILQWCHDNGVLYINTSVEEWDPYGNAETTPPDRAHAVLPPSTVAQTGRRVVASGSVGGRRPRRESRSRVALDEGRARRHRRRDARGGTKRSGRVKLSATRRRAIEHARGRRATTRGSRCTPASRSSTSASATRRSPTARRKSTSSSTRGRSRASTRRASRPPSSAGARTSVGLPAARAHLRLRPVQPDLPVADGDGHVRLFVGAARRPDRRHGHPPRRGACRSPSISRCPTASVRSIDRPSTTRTCRPTPRWTRCTSCACAASQLQPRLRIMQDEIIHGRDELGVLLMGHDLNAWWVGSQLDIDETRALVPGQNATTLQVAASVLGAVFWMINNPDRGFNVPDDLPHDKVLARRQSLPRAVPVGAERLDAAHQSPPPVRRSGAARRRRSRRRRLAVRHVPRVSVAGRHQVNASRGVVVVALVARGRGGRRRVVTATIRHRSRVGATRARSWSSRSAKVVRDIVDGPRRKTREDLDAEDPDNPFRELDEPFAAFETPRRGAAVRPERIAPPRVRGVQGLDRARAGRPGIPRGVVQNCR